MTPGEYVNEIAIPALADFSQARRSRRLAYVAAMTTFHVGDHLLRAGAATKVGIIHATMRAALPEFDVVRAVATGAKHFSTDPARHRMAFQAGQDVDRPPAFWGSMVWDRSRWGDLRGGRDVDVGGLRFDLFDTTRAVLLAFIATFPDHLAGCSYVEPVA